MLFYGNFDHTCTITLTVIFVTKWLAIFFIVFLEVLESRRFQGAFTRPSILTGKCLKFLYIANLRFENFSILRFLVFWTLALKIRLPNILVFLKYHQCPYHRVVICVYVYVHVYLYVYVYLYMTFYLTRVMYKFVEKFMLFETKIDFDWLLERF